MALPVPPDDGFTADDLPRLMETIDGPFELLDGDVVMMAPATFWHNQAVDILNSALAGQAPASVVVAREAGIRLGTSVPIPDVRAYRGSGGGGRCRRRSARGAAGRRGLIAADQDQDRKLRPAQYAEAGIACFWRVENEDDAMVVYTSNCFPKAARMHRPACTGTGSSSTNRFLSTSNCHP